MTTKPDELPLEPKSPALETAPEWAGLKHEFNVACTQLAQSARIQIAHELNQLFRRLLHYEQESEWVRLVLEGGAMYAREVALFSSQANGLVLRGAVNLTLPQSLSFSAETPASFDAVLRQKEPVTALRSPSEVGRELSSSGQLAYLFPILNGPRVAAVLFAAADASEADQLELVSNMAASALERRANSGKHSKISIAAPVPTPTPPATESLPTRRLAGWADLPADHRALHSQAARFARVSVAEMLLLKPTACRTAREKGDLYVLLGREIDKARETYQKQFMTLPSMVDYFHKELVDSILGGDTSRLGADYPGELA